MLLHLLLVCALIGQSVYSQGPTFMEPNARAYPGVLQLIKQQMGLMDDAPAILTNAQASTSAAAATETEESVTLRQIEFEAHVNKFALAFGQQRELQGESAGEYDRRLRIFSTNMAAIERHNAEAASDPHSVTFAQGSGPFTHMTREEFVEHASRGRPKAPRSRELSEIHAKMPLHTAAGSGSGSGSGLGASATPAAVDWRAVPGVLTPVKDQGICGACWSFSATGAMEAAYAIMSSSTAPTRTTNSSATRDPSTGFYGLSEQQLTSCNTMAMGCRGGFIESSFVYSAQMKGLSSEKTYPYLNAASSTAQPCIDASAQKPFNGTQCDPNFPYTIVQALNISALQSAVTRQPVSSSVQMGATMQNYAGGIIPAATGCGDLGYHSVLIVGYNTDASTGVSYWIVKMNLGAAWGVGGYFYLEQSAADPCGLMTQPSYPNLLGPSVLPSNAPTVAPTQGPVMFGFLGTLGYNVTQALPVTVTGCASTYCLQPATFSLSINWPAEFGSFQQFTSVPLFAMPLLGNTNSMLWAGGVTLTNKNKETNNYIAVMNVQRYNTLFQQSEFRVTGVAAGKTSWNQPINAFNIQPYAQALMMDNNFDDLAQFTGYAGEGFCVSSIGFNPNFNAPTFMPSAAPTTLPLPVFPILGSLVLTIHSDPLCTSAIYENDMAPYGNCVAEGQNNGNSYGSRRMTISGDYSSANPLSPLKVPVTTTYYADPYCETWLGSSTKSLDFRNCTGTDPSLLPGLYVFMNFLPTSNGLPAAPLISDPVGVYTYNTQAGCLARDPAALFGYQLVPNNQCLVLPGNKSYKIVNVCGPCIPPNCPMTSGGAGYLYEGTTCSGYGNTTIPQNTFGGQGQTFPNYPGCFNAGPGYYFSTSCEAAPNFNPSTSSADLASKTGVSAGAIAGGVVGGLLLVSLAYYGYAYQWRKPLAGGASGSASLKESILSRDSASPIHEHF